MEGSDYVEKEQLAEATEEIEENILNSKNACVETEQMLLTGQQLDEAQKNSLIYQLQRQRLDYARFHMQKVDLLKKITDHDYFHQHSPSQHTSSSYTEKSSSNHPHNTTTDKTSNYSVKVRRSSGGEGTLDPERQPDPFTSPISSELSTLNCNSSPASICDTLANALSFFGSKERGRTSPFDHLEDTNIGSKVEEVVLLGKGFEGASANSTLERKERIVDQRRIVDEQIHFVHEHIRSYRLETVLNLTDSEILANIKAEQVNETLDKLDREKMAENRRKSSEVEQVIKCRPSKWEDTPVMYQKDAQWQKTSSSVVLEPRQQVVEQKEVEKRALDKSNNYAELFIPVDYQDSKKKGKHMESSCADLYLESTHPVAVFQSDKTESGYHQLIDEERFSKLAESVKKLRSESIKSLSSTSMNSNETIVTVIERPAFTLPVVQRAQDSEQSSLYTTSNEILKTAEEQSDKRGHEITQRASEIRQGQLSVSDKMNEDVAEKLEINLAKRSELEGTQLDHVLQNNQTEFTVLQPLEPAARAVGAKISNDEPQPEEQGSGSVHQLNIIASCLNKPPVKLPQIAQPYILEMAEKLATDKLETQPAELEETNKKLEILAKQRELENALVDSREAEMFGQLTIGREQAEEELRSQYSKQLEVFETEQNDMLSGPRGLAESIGMEVVRMQEGLAAAKSCCSLQMQELYQNFEQSVKNGEVSNLADLPHLLLEETSSEKTQELVVQGSTTAFKEVLEKLQEQTVLKDSFVNSIQDGKTKKLAHRFDEICFQQPEILGRNRELRRQSLDIFEAELVELPGKQSEEMAINLQIEKTICNSKLALEEEKEDEAISTDQALHEQELILQPERALPQLPIQPYKLNQSDIICVQLEAAPSQPIHSEESSIDTLTELLERMVETALQQHADFTQETGKQPSQLHILAKEELKESPLESSAYSQLETFGIQQEVEQVKRELYLEGIEQQGALNQPTRKNEDVPFHVPCQPIALYKSAHTTSNLQKNVSKEKLEDIRQNLLPEDQTSLEEMAETSLDPLSQVPDIWKVAQRFQEREEGEKTSEQCSTITAFEKNFLPEEESHARSRPLFGRLLSSICEEGEWEERQRERSSNQTINAAVIILHWLEPELEMEQCTLDKTAWAINLVIEKEQLAQDRLGYTSDESSNMSQSTFVEYESMQEYPSQEDLHHKNTVVENFIQQQIATEIVSTGVKKDYYSAEAVPSPLNFPVGQPGLQLAREYEGMQAEDVLHPPYTDPPAQQPTAAHFDEQQQCMSLDIVAGQLKYEEVFSQPLSPETQEKRQLELDRLCQEVDLLSQNVTITLSSQIPLHPALIDVQVSHLETQEHSYQKAVHENAAHPSKDLKKENQQFVRVVEETTEIEEYIKVESIAPEPCLCSQPPAKSTKSQYTSPVQTEEQTVNPDNSATRVRHLAERQAPKEKQPPSSSAHQWQKSVGVQTSRNHFYIESYVQTKEVLAESLIGVQVSPNYSEDEAQTLGYLTDVDEKHMMFHQHEPEVCPRAGRQMANSSIQTFPSLMIKRFSQRNSSIAMPNNISESELEKVRHTVAAIRNIIHSPFKSEKETEQDTAHYTLEDVSEQTKRSSQSDDIEFSYEPHSEYQWSLLPELNSLPEYKELIEAELKALRERTQQVKEAEAKPDRETDKELYGEQQEVSYHPHERVLSRGIGIAEREEVYPPEPLTMIDKETWGSDPPDLDSHQLHLHRPPQSVIQVSESEKSEQKIRTEQLKIIKHSLDAVQRRFGSPNPGEQLVMGEWDVLEEDDLVSWGLMSHLEVEGVSPEFYSQLQHISTVDFSPTARSISMLQEESESESVIPTNDNQRITKDVKKAKKLLGTIEKTSTSIKQIQKIQNHSQQYGHLSVQTPTWPFLLPANDTFDSNYPNVLVKMPSIPKYRAISPVVIVGLEEMPLLSPVSIHFNICNKYLVQEDWSMPYFLVAKEHELLGHTKWPLMQRIIPEWLEAAAAVLLRSVKGERMECTLKQPLDYQESVFLTSNFSKTTEEVLRSPATSPPAVDISPRKHAGRRFNQYLNDDEFIWEKEDWHDSDYDPLETRFNMEHMDHDLDTDDDEPEELMFSTDDEEEGDGRELWSERLSEEQSGKLNAFKYIVIRQDELNISNPSTINFAQPSLLLNEYYVKTVDCNNQVEEDKIAYRQINQPEVVLNSTEENFFMLQKAPKTFYKGQKDSDNVFQGLQPKPILRKPTKQVYQQERSTDAEELAQVLAKRLDRLGQLEQQRQVEQSREQEQQGVQKVKEFAAVLKSKEASKMSQFGGRKNSLSGVHVKMPDNKSGEGREDIEHKTVLLNSGSMKGEAHGVNATERTKTQFLKSPAQVFLLPTLLETTKSALKPVELTPKQSRKRSAQSNQQGGEEVSDSDPELEDNPYVRRASKLFKRLDKEFLKFKQELGQGAATKYTIRFARPATLSILGSREHKLAMPELFDGLQQINGQNNEGTYLNGKEEGDHSKKWDPTGLLTNKLYKINYNPLVEKRNRYRTMEGHLEVPNEEKNLVPEIEKDWKKLYFRVKDGRFQWFANHCADEHPIEDVLLAGTTIKPNKEEWTLEVKGGKESANITVRTPSNLYEKWYQALLSHSNSKLVDAYVQPCYPPVPHYTQKVVLIELGTCSIRAGVLTNKISLPQTFFPAIGCVTDAGEVFVGIDAFKPEIRCQGRLESPIQAADHQNLVERYKLNKLVLEACLRKVLADLRVDPATYKVLLSIPQNIPTMFICDLLKTLLQELRFKAASIARQPSLILYSYDVTTGVVVDIGERLNIVPVIDEYIVENAIISLPFGAQQIRNSLKKKLNERNNGIVSFNSAVEHIFLRYIAEQSCYVATDYEEESKKTDNNAEIEVSLDKFNIGPGMENKFTIDSARFHATEGLFKPKRWNLEMKGIHQLIHDAIQQSPIDSRRTLYRNIYLTGGNSLLPGLAERLETELCKVAPASIFVQVHGSPWRYHSSYLGSQVIANSLQFENCCADLNNLNDYIKQLELAIN